MPVEIAAEETGYKWLEIAKSYEQILKSVALADSSLSAEYWQRVGLCYDYASRQASSIDDFKSLRRMSADAYERAAAFCGNESLQSHGKNAQCLANAEYVRSWLASDSSEKVKTLDKCRVLAKNALKVFKDAGNASDYGQTANLLSRCLIDRLYVSSTGEEIAEVSREAIENSEEAISVLSKLESKEQILMAFSLASVEYWFVANTSEQEEERKSIANKSVAYAENAVKVSCEVSNPYAKAAARWAGVLSTLYFTENIECALQYAQEMQEQASIVQDNFFIGVAYYLIAHVIDWKVLSEANPDKRRQAYEEILKYSEAGIRHLELVFQDAIVADTYLFPEQTYSMIASDYAVNLSEKIVYSKKAIAMGKKGLEFAIRSGAPEAMGSTLHGLSKAYYYHSNLEPRAEEKLEHLRNALGFRKEYIKVVRSAFPSNLWVLGVGLVYAAQIETDLSRTEKDEKNRANILEEALADMQEGVSSCKNWLTSRPVPSLMASVAGFEDAFGGMLVEGYSLTAETENLKKANEVYNDAAEDFKKVDLPSRVAESYWKIARNLDAVNDYEKAAKSFENAFAAYKASAQRISQFSDFYLDYASYMKAWSEIEIAKRAHNNEDYELAMQHYEKTSQLLRQSKSWLYLSLNFYAWSLLEQAEDLGRKENNTESIEAFETAIKFFQESKRILSSKLSSLDKADERDLVKRLIEASDIREEYSRGRIAIEEAKILDKKGDHIASSDKYDEAATVFQKISLIDSEQAGKEAKPLVYLCRAWQKMTSAEARGSPIMYEEAADLFKQANEHTFKESASLMALGHSSFCKALEAGTEFEITRSMSMYEEAVRHMDTAANYYLEAGFETTFDYAKATQRLFDAYVFMENAKRERDPTKQARNYSMAEKVLERASECFVKAKYHDKTEQVQRLLRKVKEERELALSLGEIFHAPSIISSTASFSTLSASEEKAVGLERFEQADIQAKLVQHETEAKVGSTVSLEIQIMNVGKQPVSLIRIENLVPHGFQLVSKPDYCQFEDMQLSMKGKRLEPLQANEMKITLKSFKTGTVEIKPRIVCVDWVGRPMFNSPEPVVFNISAASLPGRVQTGYPDLDNLLFGGIPENYSVVLASPSSDERELLIKRFLEAGTSAGQTTYYITAEVGNIADLVESYRSSFFLFLCNPRADAMIKNLPNVYKLKGIESLTDIDIALVKSFRSLDPSRKGPKRVCITILSDVLLQHHAVVTRKWLSGLLADLKSKEFITLVVINPQMHPSEEFQAILGLFEGEIRISEKETESGLEKTLRVRKLYNQRYLENEIVVTREKLES
jgi:KaiC/GvpD/RAD55 family RecA-like ATPase